MSFKQLLFENAPEFAPFSISAASKSEPTRRNMSNLQDLFACRLQPIFALIPIHHLMSTLLHIDASPRGERSVSRQLTHDFASAWKQAHPDGKLSTGTWAASRPVRKRNLDRCRLHPTDALSPELHAALAISNEFIAELETASEFVFGVPMHNFSRAGRVQSLHRSGRPSRPHIRR